MRAGKPLSVLYTPFTEGREANFSDLSTTIIFKIEHTGTAVVGCARPCILNKEKRIKALDISA